MGCKELLRQVTGVCAMLLIGITAYAQAPQEINYQAVARTANGNVLEQQSLEVRFTIIDNATSNEVYQETHDDVTTNDFGLFTAIIGDGTVQSGNFANINWGDGQYDLMVEIDDGSGFMEMGTNKLVSVPYSLHAEKADTSAYAVTTDTALYAQNAESADYTTSMSLAMLTDVAVSNINEGQILKWDGSQWVNAADEVQDADADSTNELQSLSFDNNEVSISGGNSITLPLGDDWGSQSIQSDPTLIGDGTAGNAIGIAQQGALEGQVLKWTGSFWIPMDDAVADQDADTTNELQELTFDGNTLTISQGNGVEIGDDWGEQDVASDATLDGDGTGSNPMQIAQQGANDGQILKWNGNTWMPSSDSVADGDTNNTNELQTLSVSGNDISISNGNTVSVPGDDWGSEVVNANSPLTGNGTSGSPLEIGQQGASSGQVLKWDGSAWSPADDENTNTTYTAGAGINITGSNEIVNTGDTDPSDDITTSTSAGGDLSGTYPDPTVIGLQGNSLSSSSPSGGDVLTWNNSAGTWEPQAPSGGGGDNDWTIGTNEIYNEDDSVGIGTNDPEERLHVMDTGTYTKYAIFGKATQSGDPFPLHHNVGVLGLSSAPGFHPSYGVMGISDTTTGIIHHAVHAEFRDGRETGTVGNVQANAALYAEANGYGMSGVFLGGSVAIGQISTTNNNHLFEVDGEAAKPGGGDWATPSDARFKQDIQSFDDGLSTLKHIEPVRYRYNGILPYSTDEEYVGITAQNLKDHAPYMVEEFTYEPGPSFKDGKEQERGNGKKYYSVNPSAFTYMLINATKEQQKIIEEQDEEIKELKNEIDNIKEVLKANGIEVE